MNEADSDILPTERNFILPMTDLGNGQRLARANYQDLRYVVEIRKWLVWQGQRWALDEDGEVMRRAKQMAISIQGEAKKSEQRGNTEVAHKLNSHAMKSQSVAKLHAAIELAKTEPGIPMAMAELDRHSMLLAVSNGVLDLSTGTLREAKRADYLVKYSKVEYDPDAKCPRFLAFLDRIFGGNRALIDFIQRAFGYSLTGQTVEQCLFVLFGGGSNGKTTLLNVEKEVLGDYARQCSPDTLMVKRGNSISNDIARLHGARFVATSETEDGQRFAEALIKQLTGQDTITARHMYKEFFEFVPSAKIWLAANHKPVIRGQDYAIWRRIHAIPFLVTIPPEERDPELPNKLRAENAGILAWAVKGCLEWQRQGLNPPEAVLLAGREYRKEMDAVGRYIEQRCLAGAAYVTNATAVYEDYRQWSTHEGLEPMSHTKFGKALTERGFEKVKSGTVTYRGIGLLHQSGNA